MRPPFTTEEFLDVFRQYNDAVFPMQGVLLLIGLAALGAALHGTRRGSRAALSLLGLLWLWMSLAYHLAFFTALGTVGYLFAAAFAVEGFLFLRLAFAADPTRLAARSDARGIAAALILAYAFVGYPLAAVLAGHRFPAMPTFGAPCPTTIFTLGLLLLTVDRPPRTVLVVLMAWALVASTAVLAFGMWEDVGVALAAIAVMVLPGGVARSPADPVIDANPADGPALSPVPPHPRARLIAIAAVVAAAMATGGYLAYAGTAWLRYGHIPLARARETSTLDRYMPTYEVREQHETHVAAPVSAAFAAACAFDLYDSRVVRGIVGTRELVMLRRRPHPRVREPFLHSIQTMGWGMLSASGGHELVFGAVTRPWQGEVTFRAVPATEFAAFHEPGFAKIVWSITVEPDGPGTSRVRTETRVSTTDAGSRTRFRRYWAFASPGIIVIRRAALGIMRRDAEAQSAVVSRSGSAVSARLVERAVARRGSRVRGRGVVVLMAVEGEKCLLQDERTRTAALLSRPALSFEEPGRFGDHPA